MRHAYLLKVRLLTKSLLFTLIALLLLNFLESLQESMRQTSVENIFNFDKT